MLSYKRTIYKSTFEVRESVEVYDDHFSPDAKSDALIREKALRDHRWSEPMAVGSSAFVNKTKSELGLKAMHREVHFRSER